jgi:dihydroorotate dehydrogenase (fumarate)
MGKVNFDPPLLNSANPWATTVDQLGELYKCQSTGAITTRTCTLDGFAHDNEIHQVGFFSTETYAPTNMCPGTASLNTLGYSPINLQKTLDAIKTIVLDTPNATKPVIISVTGTAPEVKDAIDKISEAQLELPVQILVEINLSCPNIVGKPPPAYSLEGLKGYLTVVHWASLEAEQGLGYKPDINSKLGAKFLPLPVGIKTPPYSNPDDFKTLQWALLATCYPFPIRDHPEGHSIRQQSLSFITSCNTLGCSIVLEPQNDGIPALGSADGSGIGGLAGAPLHPLALGNVKILRSMLDSENDLKHIDIIGIGGVSDKAGFDRMKRVGAAVVGVGTALGIEGVPVFEKILKG